MKKLLFIVLIFSALQNMYAQEASLFAHYYLDRTFYNPAYAGGVGYPIVHFIYRKQWAGFTGAPETFMLWGNGHVGNNIGVAGRIMRDNTGIFTQTGGSATISYTVKLSESVIDPHRLSFGLSLGAKTYSLNWERLGDLTDPTFYNLHNSWKMDGAFGVHYLYKKLDIGFAFPQLFNRKLNNEFAQNGFVRYFSESVMSASYRFAIGGKKEFHFTPLVLYKVSQVATNQFDLSLKVSYDPRLEDFEEYDPFFWVAYLNRSEYGHVISSGFKVKSASISYAYEFGGKGVGAYSSGSHEIMLSYHFGEKNPPPPLDDKPVADSLFAKNTDSATVATDSTKTVQNDSTAVTTDNTDTGTEMVNGVEPPMLDAEGRQVFPSKPKQGKRVVLRNMNFDSGSDKVNPNSYEALERLAEYLRSHPNLKIEIGGHTDNVGNKEFNRKLSQLRANAIARYLVSKGVMNDRIITKGYGDTEPLGSNDDEEDRAINRRIEMKFLEVKE